MLARHTIAGACFGCLLVLIVSTGYAQTFPSRPVRMVASEAGSGQDIVARIMAQDMAGSFGQPIIIENRPSNLTGDFLSRATPDGYTTAIAGGVLWLAQLTDKISYDPIKDLAPVTTVSTYPFIFATHPSVPAGTVKEFIELAKAKPGVLNAGASPSPGAQSWLGVEQFKAMAGVNIVRVPYKGAGPALTGLLANDIQLFFLAPGLAAPLVKAGKLKALAVTSLEPSPLVPGLPTVSESGLPGYDLELLSGVMVPAKTPVAIINRLNQEMVRTLNKSDIKERFLKEGFTALGCTPAEFSTVIKEDIAKVSKLLKDVGVKGNQ